MLHTGTHQPAMFILGDGVRFLGSMPPLAELLHTGAHLPAMFILGDGESLIFTTQLRLLPPPTFLHCIYKKGKLMCLVTELFDVDQDPVFHFDADPDS